VAGDQNKKDETTRRGGPPKPLARLLPKLTRKALGKRGLAEANLLADWATIVGAERAAGCRPEKLSFPRGRRSGGTLHLHATPGLAIELQHDAPRLIERINGYFGYAAVESLKFLQIPIEGPPASPSPPPVADPAELAAMRRRLDDVEDGELRETLDRLGAAVLAESAARGED